MEQTEYSVGQRVREQYGHVGQVVDVWQVAHVTWYRVLFYTPTRDIFVDALAAELSPIY